MAGSNQWVVDEKNHFAAYLNDDEGRDVAVLNRCGREHSSGHVDRYVTSPVGVPETHATTDEQWQSIVACIAAAPEMVEVLKNLRATLEVLEKWRELDGTHIDQLIASDGLRTIDAVLAKAEPPRKVKKRMFVTVEVEVEADSMAPLDAFRTRALDFVYTGGGVGMRFMGKKVTTFNELYEG